MSSFCLPLPGLSSSCFLPVDELHSSVVSFGVYVGAVLRLFATSTVRSGECWNLIILFVYVPAFLFFLELRPGRLCAGLLCGTFFLFFFGSP